MREAWDATKDSRDPSEFRAFIKRYPGSPFVTDARQSIATLEPRPEETAKPEAEPDVSTRPVYRQRPETRHPHGAPGPGPAASGISPSAGDRRAAAAGPAAAEGGRAAS